MSMRARQGEHMTALCFCTASLTPHLTCSGDKKRCQVRVEHDYGNERRTGVDDGGVLDMYDFILVDVNDLYMLSMLDTHLCYAMRRK
jgi:hypothetical protein